MLTTKSAKCWFLLTVVPVATRPYTWEYTFLAQQEIMKQFVVSAGYFYRKNEKNVGVI